MEYLIETGGPTTAARRFEIVERKGLGHPDSICDAIMEASARALAQEYLDVFGQVQHFNLDKALLASGKSSPRFAGGVVDEPIRFVYGDRAMTFAGGRPIPVEELVEEAARRWLSATFRFLDPAKHIVFQSELGVGSAELVGLYGSETARANDTSIGVGFAPVTETEQLVVDAEQYLNSKAFKTEFPETGEDVKVMGVRRDHVVDLTVALAFVDRFVESEASYFRKKTDIERDLTAHLNHRLERLDALTLGELRINALDEPGRAEAGTYLTVTGTSAEGADSGEVGRGNRVMGFIAARRPSSAEAVAGKNPRCHVGKIYNHLAQRAAERIVTIDGINEANVFLVSAIGAPLEEPQFGATHLVLGAGVAVDDVRDLVESTLAQTLREVTGFVADWLRGGVTELTR